MLYLKIINTFLKNNVCILIIIIIIINSTYKAQNLPKNSVRTKNKKNTQELWIRKSLTEQMGFQMSLELQEISDVTKTAWKRVPNSRGSKMKWAFTGWLKVNPGNFIVNCPSNSKTASKFKWPDGSWVIDPNNILNVLIHNLKTAWPTKISMPFLSSLENLL